MTEIMEKIYSKLYKIYPNLSKTQLKAVISYELDVHISTIYKWEKGERHPKEENIIKMNNLIRSKTGVNR